MRAASTSRKVWFGLGLVVLLVGAAWLWRTAPGSTPAVDLHGANVLLVTIDTLRADRLGAYSGRAGLTPTLDALAARGVRFARAWSHAPITLPAHASILTGLLPTHHGVRSNGAFRLGPEPVTLAERLRSAGYRTGAFVGAFVLDARFGLSRGFDEYDDRYETAATSASFHFVERPANRVLQPATNWIAHPPNGDTRPWFAWVHLFDPHAPYRAPAPFAEGRTPYDAEVAWTDSALCAALGELTRLGQLEHTLIVITADHGESLGDHGETTHGLFAYESTMRVPLIVVAPGLAPRVVSSPTSHVDIAPTIVDLVGAGPGPGGSNLSAEAPGAKAEDPPLQRNGTELDGRSRRADLVGATSPAAPIYLEALDANVTRGWAPLIGLVSDHWKYIDLPEPELYDLDADPNEQTNAVGRETERVRDLQSRLRAFATPPRATEPAMDASQAARLQSLGYVMGSSSPRTTFTLADDPKRLVALSEAFNLALEDFNEGRADAAVDRLSSILTERPDFLAARLSAATVMIGTGRAIEAVALLEAGPPDDKHTSAWLTRLGQALAAVGDLRKAREVLDAAVAGARGDPEPLNDLGVVLLRLGDRDAARRTFEQLLDTDPNAIGTLYNLGLLEMSARRSSAAAPWFRRIVDLDPRHADAWRGLGAALTTDDPVHAIEAWQHVLELEPKDFDTMYNLGMLLNQEGRRAEALTYLRQFLAEAPRDRYAADLPRVRALIARAEPHQ